MNVGLWTKRETFKVTEGGLGTIAERQTRHMRCDDTKPALFLCESTRRRVFQEQKSANALLRYQLL